LRLGIAYDLVRDEERLLVEAAKRRGHEVKPVFVPKMLARIDGDAPDHLRDLDFVLERCVSFYRALASSAVLEGWGLRVVNPHQVIRDCGDKLVTSIRLRNHGVPIPRTVVAFTREGAVEAARELGYPVVVKPIYGSWGRLMARALSEDDLLDVIDFRESMPVSHFKVHYLQEFVNKPGRDIRSFYVWGEVPVAIYRYSGRWKTNTALGGRAEPAELTEELVEATIKAGDAVGGGVLGVDLVESPEGGLYVIEVNAVIEFRNTVRVTGYDLAGHIIERTAQEMKR
jgi:[lysine-biosynthesis-protein LysW]--L-2-aminoadipate ligase